MKLPAIVQVQGDLLTGPAYPTDVGYDLASSVDMQCPPGQIVWIPTGVRVHCPDPYWFMITGRSSTHRGNAFVPLGIIDSEYQGELVVPIVAIGRAFPVQRSQRIAQLIFFEAVRPVLQRAAKFPPSSRGERGFGSSGKSIRKSG